MLGDLGGLCIVMAPFLGAARWREPQWIVGSTSPPWCTRTSTPGAVRALGASRCWRSSVDGADAVAARRRPRLSTPEGYEPLLGRAFRP